MDGHISAIAPKIAGNVIDVLVNDNQPVKAGDVLVRIDPRDYPGQGGRGQGRAGEAESQLRSARVGVPMTNETTESGATAAAAQLADAQAELERARLAYNRLPASDLAYRRSQRARQQAANDRAQADLARMKPLVEKAEISQLQFDAYYGRRARGGERIAGRPGKTGLRAEQDAAIRKTALDARANPRQPG